MPQLDISAFSPQIIWLIITFLILYAIMAKVALPRIGSILEKRQARIDDNLDMAQNLRKESNLDAETYDQAIAHAHIQARQAIQQTTKEISIENSKRQEELGVRLSEELRSAEERINRAKVAAMKNIHDSATILTTEAIKTLLGGTPTNKAITDVISSVISVSSEKNK